MLIGTAPVLGREAFPRTALPPDHRLQIAAGASALLHMLAVGSLFVSWQWEPPPQNTQPLEIELVQSKAETPGDAPSPTPPPTPAPAPTEPGEGATADKPPPPPPPPPEVNVGNGPFQNDPLTVTGDNVVPPAPDSRYRNQPPSYPPDAARIGAEGTVQLMIHVTPNGVPGEVRVVQSSGNRSLDGAARRAVQFWHFRPALADGRAIPFDYLLNIHFALGDHP